MGFPPVDSSNIISHCFPKFNTEGEQLQFVNEFGYLDHVIRTCYELSE